MKDGWLPANHNTQFGGYEIEQCLKCTYTLVSLMVQMECRVPDFFKTLVHMHALVGRDWRAVFGSEWSLCLEYQDATVG